MSITPRQRSKKALRASQALQNREDRLDRIFHALSDRTRRAILARVTKCPSRITELAEPFSMSLPAVSKHVRVLETAGLIQRRVDGRVHHCTFVPASLEDADQWMHFHRNLWQGALDRLAEFVVQDRFKGKEQEKKEHG